MLKDSNKFYWHANTSSGGTLSVRLTLAQGLSKAKKESALAQALKDCIRFMEQRGYIPANAEILSSSDIAKQYGHSRQYWEKLLNQGKILYRETSAGRITTDLWVKGYIDNKEKVDQYVRNAKTVLNAIRETKNKNGLVLCPVCNKDRFEFYVNTNTNVNGICRLCKFQVNTIKQ
ncbi:MAG: hypothetical protein WCV88_00780 [Patescibacteria group bacterium]